MLQNYFLVIVLGTSGIQIHFMWFKLSIYFLLKWVSCICTHTHTHANIHMHTMHHTCSQKPKFEFLFVLQHVRMGSKNLGRYITFIFHCIRKYLSIYIARCVHVCMCMFQFLLKLIVMIGNLTICTIAMVDSSLNYNNDTKWLIDHNQIWGVGCDSAFMQLVV